MIRLHHTARYWHYLHAAACLIVSRGVLGLSCCVINLNQPLCPSRVQISVRVIGKGPVLCSAMTRGAYRRQRRPICHVSMQQRHQSVLSALAYKKYCETGALSYPYLLLSYPSTHVIGSSRILRYLDEDRTALQR